MIPICSNDKNRMTELMAIIGSDRVKLQILDLLNRNEEMTIGRLRSKTKTGFKTIKNNCEFLERINLVEIERKTIGENERQLTFVKLTREGRELLRNLTTSEFVVASSSD